jgi:hypothetical protein
MHMNLDLGPLNPLLSQVQFPIGKANLIQSVQQQGASDQVIDLLQRLPDKTFNTPQEIQKELGGLGNIGNLKL